MFGERGGSSSFARHAFNELISFIAGWAILIDYIIIVAFAVDLGRPLHRADLGRIHPRLGRDRRRWCGNRPRGGDQYRRLHQVRAAAPADPDRARRRRAPGGRDRGRGDRRVPSRSAHGAHRPVHHAVGEAPRRGAGGLDAGVRRHRGGIGPRARLQLAAPGPAACRGRQRDAAAGHLRGDGGDRPDGGAGGRDAAWATDGAWGEVHRGADPGGRPELRPALAVGAAADRSGGDRADGPDVGGGDVDARPVAARVRAGHEPAGAELAGQAQSAVDALHRDPDRRR